MRRLYIFELNLEPQNEFENIEVNDRYITCILIKIHYTFNNTYQRFL